MTGDEAEPTACGVLAALGSAEHPAAAGTAAALTGAVAAMIVRKAARASARSASAAQANALLDRLLGLAQADAAALGAARTALGGRAAPGAGRQRDFELGQTLRKAADVPRAIGETCADVAQLAAAEREAVQPDFAPDVAAAAVLAAGAAQAAATLVAVNLLADANEDDLRAARRAAAVAAEIVAGLAEP